MFDDDFSWRSALAWMTTVVALATAADLFIDWSWPPSDGVRTSAVLLATPGAIIGVLGRPRRWLAWAVLLVVAVTVAYLLVAAADQIQDRQAQPGWMFHSVWAGAAWVGGATAMVVGRWLVRRGVVKLAGTGSQETLNRSDRGPIGRA